MSKMNKYSVEITETLQRTVEVEARSDEEALEKVQRMYNEEEIVLDSNDFICKDIHLLNKKEE